MFFSVKDRNLFHRVDTIGNIFKSGVVTSENITDGVHKSFDLSPKKTNILFISCFYPFWEKVFKNPVQFFSVVPCGVPSPHSNKLHYYVKRKKCKVNDVIFPSGCEACAINLGNKNMKIGIFTGVRLKNIFTNIS